MKTHIYRILSLLKFILAIFFSLIVSVSQAQNDPVFYFHQFLNAKVHFKNRSVTVVPMNYDAANDKMYFKRDGTLMELVNLEMVDSVTWGRKVFFICHDGTFMEKIKMGHGNAFIQWKLKNVNIGSQGALGSITQAKVDRVFVSDNSRSNAIDIYRLRNFNDYYLWIDGNYKKATTLKQLLKLFPEQRTSIEAFVKEKNTNFRYPDSVLELLNYCLSLKKQTP